jgi:cytochrome c
VRRARRVVLVAAFALSVSALIARVHPFGDAGLYRVETAQPQLLEHAAIPADVRRLLVAKCADCHSMETRAPLYGRFAPMSWLMERDIVEGRKRMNLSRWDSYTPGEQEAFATEIVQQTKKREMPLVQYRMIHWSSQITESDVEVLSEWSHAPSVIVVHSPAEAGGAQGAERGKALFDRRCTGCHALDIDRGGPRLRTVYGRPSGAIEGFPYSAALKKAHFVWDEQTLERWLADSDAFLPGNDMDFLVTRPEERKDLIAYLKQSADK